MVVLEKSVSTQLKYSRYAVDLWHIDYWDSFWIIEGLIQSELYDIANSTLQNFMDELERFGFIPNGGRIYYLDRSQPPLFVHMLDKYVKATNDTAILKRALPLAELELEWWSTNRTIPVTSSYTSQTYNMSHYAVVNSAPRPESYLDDYQTATGVDLTEQQRSDLYAELASGAETGNVLTILGNFRVFLTHRPDVIRLGL